jgi:hypothetical protein
MTRPIRQLLVATLLAGIPLTVSAQANPAPGAAASLKSGAGSAWAATLDCMQCVVHISAAGMWVEFGAEPVFRGMAAGGARLNGDVLVSVEGLLITTVAGARRLAQLGTHPLLLTVRRAGHELDLVFPQPIKWKFGTNDSIVVGFSAASSDSTTQRTEMNFATTRGWLGIALDCLRCTVDREDHSSRDRTIRFTTPPKVVAVEPGAASLAGFAAGDVIRTIDGYPMISAKGAERFSTLRPGQRVKFVVERRGTLVLLRLLVPPRP